MKLYRKFKYHHTGEKYIQNQRAGEGGTANLKACPQQRSYQVSTVNVVKSALEGSQEKSVKKCTMVVICFLKAKYHILKARNVQVQKGLGTKSVSLPAKFRQTRTGRTCYLHLLYN